MAYKPALSDLGLQPTQSSYKPSLADLELPQEKSFGEKLGPNILSGLAIGGHGLINAPHNIVNAFSPDTAKHIPKMKDYDYAKMYGLPDHATLSDKLIRGVAQWLPAMVAPEMPLGKVGDALEAVPYGGKLLKSMIGKGTPVGAYSATQSPDQPIEAGHKGLVSTLPFSVASHFIANNNPWVSGLARAAAGTAGAYGGYELAKAAGSDSLKANAFSALLGGVLSQIPGNVKNEARDKMLAGVNPAVAQPKLDAARRLGLSYVTPGEVGGNPFTAGTQGSVGKTDIGGQLLYEKGKQRLESERKAIENFHNTVFDEKTLGPQVSALYKNAEQARLDPVDLQSFNNNEIIKEAVHTVENNSAYKEDLKGVPKDSIAYWDMVKQALDDRVQNAPDKEATIIKKSLVQLRDTMDNVSPEYKQARALAERQIVRKKIEDSLNDKQVSGTNFYNKILRNDKKRKKFRQSLRNVPEAQKRFDDMYEVFGDLINPPTNRTQAGFTKAGMNQNRNSNTDLLSKIKERFSGNKLDKASIEIMTNPRWDEEIKNLSKVSNFRKFNAGLVDLVGKAVAASYANNGLMHLENDKYAGEK